MSGTRATDAELAYLRANYRRYGDGPACARVLGWTLGRVNRWAARLGLSTRPDLSRVLVYLASEPRTQAEVAEVAGCTRRLAGTRLRRWWLAGLVRPVPIGLRHGRVGVLWVAVRQEEGQ